MLRTRALIVDDEPLARRGIRQLLAAFPDVDVVAECRNGREAVRALATLEPDLVFLDIQMPGLDGFDVVRIHGPDRMPTTVFVTAHDDFAVRAFDAEALDYLVKPVSEARFRATMSRVRERARMSGAVALARQLTRLLEGRGTQGRPVPDRRGGPPGVRVAVPGDSGEELLDVEEIDWIEARDDGVVIHHGGKADRVRLALAALEGRLDPAQFVRIHRSSIVRLDRVRRWKAGQGEGEGTLILRDGTELPVSRRRLAEVKALLRTPGGGTRSGP